MMEIPPTPLLPTLPPAQDFTTAVKYLVRIAPIVYLAFQAWPASPAEVQPDSSMGHGTMVECEFEKAACTTSKWNPFPPTFTSNKLLLEIHIKESQL
ncbi:hypothetical protein DSO57_1022079 [Entomophthora muscae]|uniref:Uncharacterized protein n=1 Tax=Entomophthora muscae TaxID=34485 RepID=A0ACC2TQU4_9FUNG|nr:hypothetical protein DSO57_1022079 [Entomophthora muscae]